MQLPWIALDAMRIEIGVSKVEKYDGRKTQRAKY